MSELFPGPRPDVVLSRGTHGPPDCSYFPSFLSAEIGEVEQLLEAALPQTAPPDSPDDDTVNVFRADGYRRAWGW